MNLQYFAGKYIWWQPPTVVANDPHRNIAQVMDLGTFEDVRTLEAQVGIDAFKQTLIDARPGEFSERSWHYWHLTLGLAEIASVPPMPMRRFD